MPAAGADDWWRTARDELETARALKAVGKVLQAYHHAGQAVEFAIKVIYMRRKGLKELPDECKGANWHNLKFVAERAGLSGDLANLGKKDARLWNWLTVRDWDSNARFPGKKRPQRELNDLLISP